MIPDSIRREIERAIQAAEFPAGTSVHDGKAKVDASHLRRLMDELAALRADAEKCQAERAELYQEQERLRDKLARARLDAFKETHAARGDT